MSDNTVRQITTDDLRCMEDKEGLILQGCGGPPQEWVDGINDLLTEVGILLNSSVFEAEAVSSFQHDGVTCLLFPFEGVELDMGRLAMWRLQTHGQFGGTWLSDFVPDRLGGFAQEQVPQKPKMELLGQNSNIISEYVETEPPPPQAEMELSAAQVEQLDAIDNSVYQTILVFLNKTESEFPWDMEYIGNVADAIEECLLDMGQRVYRPAIITQNDGRQSVEDYQEHTPQAPAPESHKSTKKKKGRNAHER